MNACCGLNCGQCPTYLATRKDDDAARAKVAGEWSTFFKMEIKPEDINCDGCLSGSERMFMYCQNCQIRACCQSKGISTCAECGDYPCDQLNGFFAVMPAAKEGIEALRREMK